MKHATKTDNHKRDLRLKGKKLHNQKAGYGIKNNATSSIQKTREEIEPEGEQKRLKKAKR